MSQVSDCQSGKRPPKYTRQRRKGRQDTAFAIIAGKRVHLGVYGSKESNRKYRELVSEQSRANLHTLPRTVTVNDMLLEFFKYAEVYYRDYDGKPSREYELHRDVGRMLRADAGTEPATDFGPKRLKRLRDSMIEKGWTRKYVNDQVKRLRRIFRWAASEELIPIAVSQALDSVEGLRRGRSLAKESEPVPPVPAADVEATLQHLPEVVADMVRLQLLCGCRPGELVQLRPCDLDRSGEVWRYQPDKHKTAYRGHKRIVAIGPKGQEILLRYLARGDEMYCFRPQDSEQKRLLALSATRTTPISCGNRRGSNRVSDPKRQPGEKYTTDSYRRAVERAAKRANVTPWTPHRLRHSTATLVRQLFGLDAAQSVLGHRNAKITEVYAELHAERAAEVAAKIG